MSTKTKTDKKTPAKTKPATEKTTSATETKAPAAEATASTETKSTDKAAGISASARPISYFSSVSTDEYRSGWDDIFQTKKPATRKRAANGKKKPTALPATIELSADDLDEALLAGLEKLFRRQAKSRRLNYDKLAASGQVNWRIACEIGD